MLFSFVLFLLGSNWIVWSNPFFFRLCLYCWQFPFAPELIKLVIEYSYFVTDMLLQLSSNVKKRHLQQSNIWTCLCADTSLTSIIWISTFERFMRIIFNYSLSLHCVRNVSVFVLFFLFFLLLFCFKNIIAKIWLEL